MSQNKQAAETALEMNGMVPGQTQVYEDPEGVEKADHAEHGTAVVREAGEGRVKMLERLFETMPAASAQAKAEIAATSGEGWGTYESHAAVLQKNAAHEPEAKSLTDRVKKEFGRR